MLGVWDEDPGKIQQQNKCNKIEDQKRKREKEWNEGNMIRISDNVDLNSITYLISLMIVWRFFPEYIGSGRGLWRAFNLEFQSNTWFL